MMHSSWFTSFSLALLCVTPLCSRPAIAQPSATPTLVAQAFKAPAGQAVPDRRRLPPPRSSNNCATGELPLSTLIPAETYGMPRTAAAQPTFYAYLPAVNADALEFVLFSGRRALYKQRFQPPTTAGIVQVTLPEDVTLEPTDTTAAKPIAYQWYFTVICDAGDRRQDLNANGWIYRTDATVTAETAAEFAEQGLWYDALHAAYRENPETANNLLNSVSLSEFVDLPVLPDLTPVIAPAE